MDKDNRNLQKLNEWKIDKDTSRPKLSVLSQIKYAPNNESFMEMEMGVFHKYSYFKSDGDILKTIGIDPGQKNIWCASKYNYQYCYSKGDATKTLNLAQPEYNKGVGMSVHWKWMEEKMQKHKKYKTALKVMSENTLKIFSV